MIQVQEQVWHLADIMQFMFEGKVRVLEHFETIQQREHDVVSHQHKGTGLGDCNQESWAFLEEKNHIHATERSSRVRIVIAIMER